MAEELMNRVLLACSDAVDRDVRWYEDDDGYVWSERLDRRDLLKMCTFWKPTMRWLAVDGAADLPPRARFFVRRKGDGYDMGIGDCELEAVTDDA